MRSLRARAAVLVAAVITLAGCGIAPESRPTAIQPPPGVLLSPSPQPLNAPTGTTPEQLYFVKDGMIVRVTRKIAVAATATSLLRDLLAGPTEGEAARDITSALLGDQVVQDVRVANGQAVVALATPIADTARNDDVLAYAQLVCTLTSLSDVNSVQFTSSGTLVAVPTGDGSLSQSPLTSGNYANLIVYD